jgi:hypothetical protein
MHVHVYKYNIISKNDLKYKHSGATGKLVGVVSIEDIVRTYTHVYVHTWFSVQMCALFQSESTLLEKHATRILADRQQMFFKPSINYFVPGRTLLE